jgi:hypothetical protein
VKVNGLRGAGYEPNLETRNSKLVARCPLPVARRPSPVAHDIKKCRDMKSLLQIDNNINLIPST